MGLTDNTGALVADYRYDAWGSQGPEINDDVGYLNPFRYRGYIYDVETGLYYLKSRYYNSMICRFVNSDNIAANNAFSYTSNAPVITADETGHYREILVNKSFARTDDYTGVFIYRYCGSTRKKKAQKTGSYNIITGVGTALDLTAVYEVTYIYGTLVTAK